MPDGVARGAPTLAAGRLCRSAPTRERSSPTGTKASGTVDGDRSLGECSATGAASPPSSSRSWRRCACAVVVPVTHFDDVDLYDAGGPHRDDRGRAVGPGGRPAHRLWTGACRPSAAQGAHRKPWTAISSRWSIYLVTETGGARRGRGRWTPPSGCRVPDPLGHRFSEMVRVAEAGARGWRGRASHSAARVVRERIVAGIAPERLRCRPAPAGHPYGPPRRRGLDRAGVPWRRAVARVHSPRAISAQLAWPGCSRSAVNSRRRARALVTGLIQPRRAAAAERVCAALAEDVRPDHPPCRPHVRPARRGGSTASRERLPALGSPTAPPGEHRRCPALFRPLAAGAMIAALAPHVPCGQGVLCVRSSSRRRRSVRRPVGPAAAAALTWRARDSRSDPKRERCGWPDPPWREWSACSCSLLDEVAALDAVERYDGIGALQRRSSRSCSATERRATDRTPRRRCGRRPALEPPRSRSTSTPIVVLGCTAKATFRGARPPALCSPPRRPGGRAASRIGPSVSRLPSPRPAPSRCSRSSAAGNVRSARAPRVDGRTGRERLPSRFLGAAAMNARAPTVRPPAVLSRR